MRHPGSVALDLFGWQLAPLLILILAAGHRESPARIRTLAHLRVPIPRQRRWHVLIGRSHWSLSAASTIPPTSAFRLCATQSCRWAVADTIEQSANNHLK